MPPAGTNIGSYPNPRPPLGGQTTVPSARPRNVAVSPSGQARHSALTNQARRSAAPAIRSQTSRIAVEKSFSGPAHRALNTPGAPPSAATQNPESSASAGSPLAVAATAFSRALPAKSGAVSSGSGNPSAPAETTSTPRPVSNACNSTTFPGLCVASTSLRGAVICFGGSQAGE